MLMFEKHLTFSKIVLTVHVASVSPKALPQRANYAEGLPEMLLFFSKYDP